MFLNVQLSLEEKLSPLRIFEAKVENLGWSDPCLSMTEFNKEKTSPSANDASWKFFLGMTKDW